ILVTGTPPMDIAKDGRALACSTSWPAGTFGVTGPKPMPYSTISSLALAGREVTPAIAPTGRTKVPSANSATTYCVPPTLNNGGASSPGSTLLTAMLNGALERLPTVIVTGCMPVAVFDGTSAFTCPGLIKSTKAACPPTETAVPPSQMGAFKPLKSAPAQVCVPTARFDP